MDLIKLLHSNSFGAIFNYPLNSMMIYAVFVVCIFRGKNTYMYMYVGHAGSCDKFAFNKT